MDKVLEVFIPAERSESRSQDRALARFEQAVVGSPPRSRAPFVSSLLSIRKCNGCPVWSRQESDVQARLRHMQFKAC